MKKPTPRQLDILIFCKGFQETNGKLPTTTEVATALNLGVSTIGRHFIALSDAGLIKRVHHAWNYELIYNPGLPYAPNGDPLYSVPLKRDEA